MTAEHLLPESSSTPIERAISAAIDVLPRLEPTVDTIRAFKAARPLIPSVGPWLIHEYGLGGVSRFFATAEEAIDAGVPWTRIRGTVGAVEAALSWIGYSSITMYDERVGRRIWNAYQVDMGALPLPDEVQLLTDAEYLANLSDAARSYMFRGFFQYDLRALSFGSNRWGDTMWGDSSGVRLPGGTVKWSHRRNHAVSASGSAANRTELGVNFSVSQPLTWGAFSWNTLGLTWDGVADVAAAKTTTLCALDVYMAFYDAADDVIGYRRIGEAVEDTTAIENPGPELCHLTYTAQTDFGDGAGQVAVQCALIFGAMNIDPSKPGKAWLEPDEIAFPDGANVADRVVGKTALSIDFKQTIRERVVFGLTI